ncbi:MAG: type II secretion system protein [Sulfurospirillaceae bacterium]|nr:type II secretion system protein [Sulfurospirillaceae bacterium]
MRRGLSLIELIFTMVIIAMVFTVVPKIVLSLNKSDEFSIRQDALFNGFSFAQMLSRLAWDEQNTNSSDILSTGGNPIFTCSTLTKYRLGGFKGSRNCEHDLNATANFMLKNENETTSQYDDIDDFQNEQIDISSVYELVLDVHYLTDDDTVFNYAGRKAFVDLNRTTSSTPSTNLKEVTLRIDYVGKRGEKKQLSQLSYVSSNIGLYYLNKRVW